jgi:hypothetical protein
VALYEALREYQVTRDEAEVAAVEECCLLGKPVEGPEITGRGDRTSLFRSFALCANMSETTLLQKLVYNIGAEETKE